MLLSIFLAARNRLTWTSTRKPTGTLYTAFPDARHSIDELIAEGDLVAFRYGVRCTHQGEFQGAAPTGKAVNITAMAIARVAGGKIVEAWIEFDMLGVMQKIDAIPASTQVAS